MEHGPFEDECLFPIQDGDCYVSLPKGLFLDQMVQDLWTINSKISEANPISRDFLLSQVDQSFDDDMHAITTPSVVVPEFFDPTKGILRNSEFRRPTDP